MKNKINLPGFLANAISNEIFLNQKHKHNNNSLFTSRHVIMQMINLGHLGCAMQCSGSSDPFCYDQCELGLGPTTGGGGGGGSNQLCRPFCGRCVNTSTGRYKFCINRSCDVRQVRCN
jgi:hypothetical protein